MSGEDITPLILDLVEWVCERDRSYSQCMEVWRTSCPRLPVWETAMDEGYLSRQWRGEQGEWIVATDTGREFLSTHGRTGKGRVAVVNEARASA